jgi:hypothetical protein
MVCLSGALSSSYRKILIEEWTYKAYTSEVFGVQSRSLSHTMRNSLNGRSDVGRYTLDAQCPVVNHATYHKFQHDDNWEKGSYRPMESHSVRASPDALLSDVLSHV